MGTLSIGMLRKDKPHHLHQLLAYHKPTGTTARKINLGHVTVTAVGQYTGWNGCRTDLYKPMRGCAGQGELQGAHKGRQSRVQKGPLHVLVQLDLYLNTTICPVLFWNLSLPLRNLALSHAHVLQEESARSWWSSRSRFGASCWSKAWHEDTPCLCYQRLEPGGPHEAPGAGKRGLSLQANVSRVVWAPKSSYCEYRSGCIFLKWGVHVPVCVSHRYVLSFNNSGACSGERGSHRPQPGQRLSPRDASWWGPRAQVASFSTMHQHTS